MSVVERPFGETRRRGAVAPRPARQEAEGRSPTRVGRAPEPAAGATAEPPNAPLRLTDVGLAAVLEQFQGSPLLSSGKVNVIALDAISERLGDRWKVRRDLVHDHAEAVMRRQLGPSSVVQRISDTEYIVVQPQASRESGQLQCLNGLREIMRHFLGDARSGDLKVHEVTRITSAGVFGQRLDAASVEAAEGGRSRTEALSAAATEAPARKTLDRWTPFASSTGRRITVSCSLEPVMQLRNSVRIGYRVTRRVLELPSRAPLSAADFERLSSGDIEKIDLASIARGLDRLRSLNDREKPLSLILTVSYTTLQGRRARPALLSLLAQAGSAVRHGIIMEVSGIDGAPAAALPLALSVLRPFCRRVIGRLADGLHQDVRFLRGAGLDGLSVRCPPTDGDAQFIGWAKSFVAAATRVARPLFVYDVGSMQRAKLAASIGVTHVTLAPQRLRDSRMDDEVPSGAFRSTAWPGPTGPPLSNG